MKLGGQVGKFNLSEIIRNGIGYDFKADFACINHFLWKNSQAFFGIALFNCLQSLRFHYSAL